MHLQRPRPAAGAGSRSDHRLAGSGSAASFRWNRGTSTATAAYWYPQSSVSDYATARLSISVDERLRRHRDWCAGGRADARRRSRRAWSTDPAACSPSRASGRCAISPSSSAGSASVTTRKMDDVTMTVMANARQAGRAQDMTDRAADIFQFYKSLVGRAPYPSFTLVFTERDVPGGHSPAYFAVVDQVPVQRRRHLAERPGELRQLSGVLRRARDWRINGGARRSAGRITTSNGSARGSPSTSRCSMRKRNWAAWRRTCSDRCAARRSRSRRRGRCISATAWATSRGRRPVFRSIVYNKAAMVLHMLRQLIGDEAFFKGVRTFYDASEFKKAGTGDFQAVMEKVSGRSLGRFFRRVDLRRRDTTGAVRASDRKGPRGGPLRAAGGARRHSRSPSPSPTHPVTPPRSSSRSSTR